MRGWPVPDLTRPYDVRRLTSGELDRTMRELRANLALVRPGSPALVPILAHLDAIDAEVAARGAAQLSQRGRHHQSPPEQLGRIGELSDQRSFLRD